MKEFLFILGIVFLLSIVCMLLISFIFSDNTCKYYPPYSSYSYNHEPLDTKIIVDSIDSLTNGDLDAHGYYKGMLVHIINNSKKHPDIYMFNGKDNKNINNWILFKQYDYNEEDLYINDIAYNENFDN